MEKDIKSSVRLPKTDFEMKPQFNQVEKEVLEAWKNNSVYEKILQKNLNSPKFVLHDGPPYANGNIHLGHSLNKILKDILVKGHMAMGYQTPFVLGWDCHGLPIEWKIEELNKEKGLNKSEVEVNEFRSQCESFAHSWVKIQSEEFKTLGILADFENPYLTTNKKAESIILESIFTLLKQGAIYQGKKPVMWSAVEQTALAEAEVEYMDKKSDTVFVSLLVEKAHLDSWKNSSVVIWTTTPWTLPSNQAIAYGEEIEYGLYKINKVSENSLAKINDKLIIATSLVDSVFATIGVIDFECLDKVVGLSGFAVQHPLYSSGYKEIVPALSGDFVDTSVGSGIVHIAPAHGEEDFYLCKKYNITPKELVLDNGTYNQETIAFAGDHVFKVNPKIIEHLKNNGNLLNHTPIKHSYPHSWRSKAPLIYRLTSQWFISMDHNNLRQKVIESLDTINFYPKTGKNRLLSMIQTRPDWCISRQRSWGVPLCIFLNVNTLQPLIDEEVFNNIINAFEKEGSNAWFKEDPKRFLTSKYNKEDYKVISDVVDVWVDSGLTHNFVLKQNPALAYPADVYLEGSDQHRGWFQSSLVLSILLFGKAPFKNIITHGFTLDEKGQKMSKSLGNVMTPQDIISVNGADTLRLWVANANYSEDISLGKNILAQQSEYYRKIRNVLRYLIANLSTNFIKVEYDNLLPIDKWLVHNIYELDKLFEQTFKESFNIHSFFAKLFNFMSIDLSSFYFDIKKDILYCDGNNSAKLNSTLTSFSILFDFLLKWLSPFICFTAEEAYAKRYSKPIGGLFLSDFVKAKANYQNIDMFNEWEEIKKIRKVVSGAMELHRASKDIGSSLEATPIVYVENTKSLELLKGIDFAEVCIVSNISILPISNDINKSELFSLDDVVGIWVKFVKTSGVKCVRCWKYFDSLKEDDLCERCSDVVGDL
jgi:isoleucyl-tRNA synthetase